MRPKLKKFYRAALSERKNLSAAGRTTSALTVVKAKARLENRANRRNKINSEKAQKLKLTINMMEVMTMGKTGDRVAACARSETLIPESFNARKTVKACATSSTPKPIAIEPIITVEKSKGIPKSAIKPRIIATGKIAAAAPMAPIFTPKRPHKSNRTKIEQIIELVN